MHLGPVNEDKSSVDQGCFLSLGFSVRASSEARLSCLMATKAPVSNDLRSWDVRDVRGEPVPLSFKAAHSVRASGFEGNVKLIATMGSAAYLRLLLDLINISYNMIHLINNLQ